MPGEFVFNVSEVNSYVKKIIDYEDLLQSIKVRGEISNFRKSAAGHVYFTLKDEQSAVRCVWFDTKQGVAPDVKNGDKVILTASASFYIKSGEFQLVVKAVTASGLGYWYQLFSQIKQKLASEGLFDQSIKKPLPKNPGRIGVITSESGAAFQDIIKVIKAKQVDIDIVLFPVTVQGETAAHEISHAIDWFSHNRVVDLLIISRGGGSIEDLWPFNEETVARSIFACPVPVISAVGHETDFSISDFAADVRAATPTDAADIALKSRGEYQLVIERLSTKLDSVYSADIESRLFEIGIMSGKIQKYSPKVELENAAFDISTKREKIYSIIKYTIESRSAALSARKGLIESFSPQRVLERGYSILMDDEKHILSDVSSIKAAVNFNVIVKDGKLPARIREDRT